MATQKEIKEIAREVDDPPLSDVLLVAKIVGLRQDKARIAAALKKASTELVDRLKERGVTEEQIGDDLVVISPKLHTEYDCKGLDGLRNCATDDQLWLTIKQLPSGKQLTALSDLAGASAKAVIASAKRKIDTGTTLVRIKKPRRRGRGKSG